MNVLIVSQYYMPYTSGMTVYIQQLAESLAANKNSVTILTTQHEKTLPRQETMNGVNVLRTPVLLKYQRGSFSPLLTLKFIRIARRYDVINIHAPFFEADVISAMAFVLTGKRPILTYHCDLSMKKGFFSKLIELSYYTSVKIAAFISGKIVMNSLDFARYSRMRRFMNKVVEIHPPVDCEKFHKTDPAIFRKKHGVDENDKVIGFAGRLVREKGLEYLIKAIPGVKKEFPNIKCLIVGEGEKIAGGRKESEKEKLSRTVEELDLAKEVFFLGHIPNEELPEFYSACDVFVLPSVDPLESFGIVQVEAMLCGCPVIATDIPGVRQVLEKTGMGILVKPENADDLEKAILSLLSDRDKYLKSVEIIRKEFDLKITSSKYQEVLGSITV